MNKKIIAIVFLTVGVAIGHGFPTLYQYIDTLGGDYTSAPQRTEILNADILNGEPMKASTMNAKFNAMNAELGELASRITTVEGLSGGGTIVSGAIGCGSGCFFILNGIADGETVAKNYLVHVSSTTASIVYRKTLYNASYNYGGYFDDGIYGTGSSNTGTNNELTRIKASEIDIDSFNCSTDECFFILNGIADAETVAKDYLVVSEGTTASIVYRKTLYNASYNYGGYFDDGIYGTGSSNTGGDIESTRIKAEEVDLSSFKCSDRCFFILNGIADAETVAKDYLVVSEGTTASIVYRKTLYNASYNYGGYFDDGIYGTGSSNTGGDIESTRIKAEEVDLSSLKCSSSSCFFILSGIADTETVAKDYLVSVSSTTASIIYRKTLLNGSYEYGGYFDDGIYGTGSSNTGGDIESTRIKAEEVDGQL